MMRKHGYAQRLVVLLGPTAEDLRRLAETDPVPRPASPRTAGEGPSCVRR